jgi:hypothetical protein
MSRAFVQLWKTTLKGVSIDVDATEGAIIGENLFIRQSDGTLALFEPSSGVVTPSVGNAVTVSITTSGMSTSTQQVGGSNSGYQQDISPAAAPTNFDLDASMIAGLNNPEFPTLNYILVGNGVSWVAVPMTGDATILASGAITANVVSKTATASGTNTYTATFNPVAFITGVVYTVTFTNGNTTAATLNTKAIKFKGSALVSGDIPASSTLALLYDGTNLQIVGPSLGAGSGFLLAANNLSDVVSAIASIDHISKISTTIAAAATTDLTTATGDSVTITGAATISSLGNGAAGIRRVTSFSGGGCVLVHNVASMDLITQANITTVIGDKCEWVSVGSSQWVMVWYTRYDGTALVGGSSVTAGTGLVDTSNVISLAHSVYVYFG